MQAVVGLEIGIGISPVHLHGRVVRFGISFVRLVSSMATTSKSPSTCSELFQVLDWQNRRSMVLGFSAVDLVNGHCGMDYFWLDGLLVNDGLDVLVNYFEDVLKPFEDRVRTKILALP
jgi:hypothetical protein